jgi:Spy/CpxP family protein refolding chaperone
MKAIESTWPCALALLLALAAAAPPAFSQGGSYAGQQDRQIKSLSEKEVEELLAGQGMGLAKAAELNGYPGPAHVLEHAAALALSEGQRRATEALMQEHRANARSLGAEVVQAEKALDTAFARGEVDRAGLARLIADIAARQARLREEHLQTHLEQTAMLSRDQVRKYAELRGYGAAASSPEAQPSHPRKHH